MKLYGIVVLLLSSFLTYTNTIRCYKCDATDVCKTIRSSNFQSNDNYHIVDCQHYCWKSISLGNVYRGCGRKRCAVSHTIGTFSTSVCCQTDYCNKSNRLFIPKYFLMIIMLIVYLDL